MPVLAAIWPSEFALAAEEAGVLDLLFGVGDGPADLPSGGFGDGAGVRGALGGEGAFHLREQGQQQEGDAAHALVGGVDRQRVGQGPHADAAAGQVVHEVEDLAQVAADPVEGVHHDRVAGPRIAQQLVQAVAVDGGAGLLVGVDPLAGDARRGERVELAIQALPGGGDAGVAEVEPALGMIVTRWHAARPYRYSSPYALSGTRVAGRLPERDMSPGARFRRGRRRPGELFHIQGCGTAGGRSPSGRPWRGGR